MPTRTETYHARCSNCATRLIYGAAAGRGAALDQEPAVAVAVAVSVTIVEDSMVEGSWS